MSDTISDRVKAAISEKLGIDIAKVTEDARFIDDFGADSLDTVDLVMALEDEFGVEINNKDSQNIQSVKDAIEFIEQHVSKSN